MGLEWHGQSSGMEREMRAYSDGGRVPLCLASPHMTGWPYLMFVTFQAILSSGANIPSWLLAVSGVCSIFLTLPPPLDTSSLLYNRGGGESPGLVGNPALGQIGAHRTPTGSVAAW